MSGDDTAGVLDLIMTLPLGFDKVSIDTSYIEQDGHGDAVNELECEKKFCLVLREFFEREVVSRYIRSLKTG